MHAVHNPSLNRSGSRCPIAVADVVGSKIFNITVTRQEVDNLSEEVTALTPEKKPSVAVCSILLIIGVALLGLGAQWTVLGASQLARMPGFS